MRNAFRNLLVGTENMQNVSRLRWLRVVQSDPSCSSSSSWMLRHWIAGSTDVNHPGAKDAATVDALVARTLSS